MENNKPNYLVKGTKIKKSFPQNSDISLENSTQNYSQQLLRGCINIHDISNPPLREVRIFLSSTFSDFKIERNLFIKKVIPELQSACKEYRLHFHLCDMRWGITDSAVNEHLVEKLCLKEIQNCRKISIGPFFVLLIGNRYGYQPIPCELPSSEFEMLYQLVLDNFPKEADIIAKWFEKDENAIPPVHVLLPIKTHIPKYADYGDEVKRRESGHEWWKVEESIRKSLNKACNIACVNGSMTTERKNQLTRSVTEAEFWNAIVRGDLHIDKREASRCLAYERHLSGLTKDLQSSEALKYIDYITRDDEVIFESSAQLALAEFKKSIHKIGISQFRKFDIPWTSSGITEELMSHKTYLDKLTSLIIDDAKKVIIDQLSNNTGHSKRFERSKHQLQSEITHHWLFCRERSSLFCGREAELFAISKLLDQKKSIPIVVCGDSGCGKTAFMARLANLIQLQLLHGHNVPSKSNQSKIYECFQTNQSSVLILRFIGISPMSSTIQQLLFSLCFQIQLAYQFRVKFRKMTSISGLQWLFNHLLHLISRRFSQQMPLIIILDSIDKLESSKIGDAKCTIPLFWIPTDKLPGVHIILSFVTQIYQIPQFKFLESRIAHCKDSLITINAFNPDEVMTVFRTFQEIRGRKLTEQQMSVIIPKLMNNSQALYIKTIMEETFLWTSFLPTSEWIIADTIESAIELMFSRLENKYGNKLIAYTFGYLSLGFNGLSDIEIEDLLSLQDNVLNEVYQYHDPPIKGVIRLPSLLWSRIHSDLSGYIEEKQTYNNLTHTWHHKVIHQCAINRYVSSRDMYQILHTELADYYAIDDIYERSCTLHNHKRHLEIPNANRLINNAKISSDEPRKMRSLSFHLMESGNVLNLLKFCVANLDFLISYATCFSVQELILWIKHCEEIFPQNAVISIIKHCIVYNESLLETDLDYLSFQLLGQLNQLEKSLVHVEGTSLSDQNDANTISMLQSLCYQCEENLSKSINLIPSIACFPSCLGSLKFYMEKIDRILQLPDDPNQIILIGHKEDEWVVRLFHLKDKVTVCSIVLENEPISVKVPCENSNFIFIQDNNCVLIYDTETSQLCVRHELVFSNKFVLNECMTVDHEGKWIAVAAQNRIALLEHKFYNFGKHPIACKLVLTTREVDKTLSMCFIRSAKQLFLLTAHTYNSRNNKAFLIKSWQCHENHELWTIELQTLSNHYDDFIYLWPFPSLISNDNSSNPILIVLPNGSCYFSDNVSEQKLFRNLTETLPVKHHEDKLRSITSDGIIVTIVRIVDKQTFVQKIDRNGILSIITIPDQINKSLISFATLNFQTNSLLIGIKTGLIFYICNDQLYKWVANKGTVDYIYYFNQVIESTNNSNILVKCISFSRLEKAVKCWSKTINHSVPDNIFSKTIYEEMTTFALSRSSNLFTILNGVGSLAYTGSVAQIGINNGFKGIELDTACGLSNDSDLEYHQVIGMEIVLQDQAVLIFYSNNVRLYNLSNGKAWASFEIKEQPGKHLKTPYWYCLHGEINLLLLTYKKSTGYFSLDCHTLPTLGNIKWNKRFLPPINYARPQKHLDKIISISNFNQDFLLLRWKNSESFSSVPSNEVRLTQRRSSFQFTSLDLHDPSTTLGLTPCFNQEETKKISSKTTLSKMTNQFAFCYAIPQNIPCGFPSDMLLSNAILLGGFGEILIWDMKSGFCRLPKISNILTWFKHSATVKSSNGDNESKSLKSRASNNISLMKSKKNPITALIITENMKVISGCSAGFVLIWKWADVIALNGAEPDNINKYRFVLSAKHGGKVICLVVSPDQSILCSGSTDKEIFLSNIVKNQCHRRIFIHCCPISLSIYRYEVGDDTGSKSQKYYLICKAIHISQTRMLSFNIFEGKTK